MSLMEKCLELMQFKKSNVVHIIKKAHGVDGSYRVQGAYASNGNRFFFFYQIILIYPMAFMDCMRCFISIQFNETHKIQKM